MRYNVNIYTLAEDIYSENTNSLIQVSSVFSTTQNDALNCTECWDNPWLRWPFGKRTGPLFLNESWITPCKAHQNHIRLKWEEVKNVLHKVGCSSDRIHYSYIVTNNISIKLHCLVKMYVNYQCWIVKQLIWLIWKTDLSFLINWHLIKAYPLISTK